MRNFLNMNSFVKCAKQLEEGATSIGIHVLPLKDGEDQSGNTHVLRHVYYEKDFDKCVRMKTLFLGRIRVNPSSGFAKRFSGWINYKTVIDAHNECLQNRKTLQIILFKNKTDDEYRLSIPIDDNGKWITIASLKSIDKFSKSNSQSNREHADIRDMINYSSF